MFNKLFKFFKKENKPETKGTLILRMCNKDGSSSCGFKYGQVGDRVTAPDWDPKPECGNGLHGFKDGNGDWLLLSGEDWLIIDADDQVVDIDGRKCKFNTGVILFRGTTEKLRESNFVHRLNLDSPSAYSWAKYIGNRDVMINKITDSEWAYHWATDIGNRDVMIHKINDSLGAYLWAINIGNQDIMINKINDSGHAYLWAISIGDQDVMKPKIVDPYYIRQWNISFPSNRIKV